MIFENFSIKLIDNSKYWYELFNQFKDANIYQTWNYSKIVQDEKQVHHLALFKDEELIGLAQVRIKTLPVMQRGIAYIFSGPLWRRKNKHNSPENFLSIVNTLKNEYTVKKKLVFRFRPYIFSDEKIDPILNQMLTENLSFRRSNKEYSSLLVDMNNDLETINKNLRPRWRNYLNQATRNDLKIVEGNNSELYSSFIKLYGQMMDRKDFREYVNPIKMGKLNELLEDSVKLKIFIAYKDDKPVAGLVGTAIGDTGIYLLGATNEMGLELRASYMLHWEMIKWMKAMNCFRYDLGGINKIRNPGGFKFKSGISDVEISDIGTFEYRAKGLSKFIISAGEKLRSK
jgi:lipid II:glycine glycyltransferase (peptidoglycan interpeptide bridge formation enzyme)